MKEVLLVVFRVPLGKMSETFSYPDLRSESVVLLQRSTVSTGHRNVAGLHTDQFPMALEVVVSRKNSGSDQFLLQRGNIVQNVLRPAVLSQFFKLLPYRHTLHTGHTDIRQENRLIFRIVLPKVP